MTVSQLLHVMDKDDDIVINNGAANVQAMCIYEGVVRHIKRDNPVNRMHVAAVCACEDTIFVLAEEPKSKRSGS